MTVFGTQWRYRWCNTSIQLVAVRRWKRVQDAHRTSGTSPPPAASQSCYQFLQLHCQPHPPTCSWGCHWSWANHIRPRIWPLRWRGGLCSKGRCRFPSGDCHLPLHRKMASQCPSVVSRGTVLVSGLVATPHPSFVLDLTLPWSKGPRSRGCRTFHVWVTTVHPQIRTTRRTGFF